MKQTAVEFLEQELISLISFNTVEMRELFRNKVAKAKKQEKEQIKSIYIDGIMSTTEGWCGEMILSFPTTSYSAEDAANDYYNETYGE